MRTITTAILLMLISTLSAQQLQSTTTAPLVVTGKVLGAENYPDNRTIQFFHHDILTGEQVPSTAIIRTDGEFLHRLPLPLPQDLFFRYGDAAAPLYGSPGDTIILQIDALYIFGTDDEMKKPSSWLRIKGSTGETNEAIIKYGEQRMDGPFSFFPEMRAVVDNTPDAYKAHIRNRVKEQLRILEEFNTTHNTTEEFRHWAGKDIKYNAMDDLMRYPWLHPSYSGINPAGFKVPDTYYDFLDDHLVEDLHSYLLNQASFLHELQNYQTRYSLDAVNAQFRKLAEEGMVPIFRIRRDAFKELAGGSDLQILLTRLYLKLLDEAGDTDIFNALYEPSLIDNPLFAEAIAQKVNALETADKPSEEPVPVVTPPVPQRQIALTLDKDDLLASLVSPYQGKVVYIDFWAPWCGPCLGEMPHSKKIKEHFKDDNVVFLYLGVQTTEQAWLETRERLEIEGEHLLLTNDQYNVLASTFGISGIPHYVLIDKNGAVASKKATRPSFGSILIREIEELLKR